MIRAIITDIEGTTTDINFVHKVLFPYSREHMAAFITQHQNKALVISELNAVKETIRSSNATIDQLIDQLLQWIDEDKKIAPLKNIQGLIWEEGFKTGAFQGHVYPDAFLQLKKWHDENIKIYVYSSGSVQAQRLLFGYSVYGDLTPLFSGYFDTQVGGKREANSYQTILNKIQCPPGNTLFLSDIIPELDAARACHIHTALINRDGASLDDNQHPVYTSFSELQL